MANSPKHHDIIKWKHFPRYWPFVRRIHPLPVNSPHKDQWREALMFSLICTWINGWVNNREAGDLRRHRAHCDVIVMMNFNKMNGSLKFSYYLKDCLMFSKHPPHGLSYTWLFLHFFHGLCSLSGETSYRQISQSLEAARFCVIMIASLWNLTGISVAVLPMCLSTFRAIGKVWTRISRLRVFARSCGRCPS